MRQLMKQSRGLTVFLAVLALLGCVGFGGKTAAPRVAATGPDASTPCRSATPGGIQHVIWVLMENKASAKVVGSPSAPYLSGVGRRCGIATNDHGVAHPSLPNYIALTSGSTHGITDDNNPKVHPVAGPSIFSQVAGSGRTWRSYEESMPSNCRRTNAVKYAVRHNPATYYTGLNATCPAADVPYPQLAKDLSANRLPAFSFVTPNLCDDMHDCGIGSGDAWLSRELPKILDSSAYRSGTTAVFITWDEDDHTSGNQIPLYVVAPSVRPGTVSGTSFQHPALLNATEQMLGLPALPGATGGSALRNAFQL
jgi:hypothetical protein